MDLLKSITSSFKKFLTYYGDYKRIYIKYGFKKEIFNDYYPDWQKDRLDRLSNGAVLTFIKKDFIPRLKKISHKITNIEIEEWDEAFIVDVLKDMEYNKDSKDCIILSRNMQLICLFAYSDVSIYNGRKIIDKFNYKDIKDFPNVSYTFIPHWFLLRGDKRNSYVGLNKTTGVKKANNLINSNKEKCVDFSLPELQKVIKYKNLYFIKEVI